MVNSSLPIVLASCKEALKHNNIGGKLTEDRELGANVNGYGGSVCIIVVSIVVQKQEGHQEGGTDAINWVSPFLYQPVLLVCVAWSGVISP